MYDKAMIIDHYREQAVKWKDDARSTMEDETIRNLEVDKLVETVGLLIARSSKYAEEFSILDLGCGNGYTVGVMSEKFPAKFTGFDMSDDMLDVAINRDLPGVDFKVCDITIEEDAPEAAFDIVYTERCLINILDEGEQIRAMYSVCRMLKPGGFYVMMESFQDGTELTNKARMELGIDPIGPPFHNLFFDKNRLFEAINPIFHVVDFADIRGNGHHGKEDQHFLSSYYFMSRVFYPSVTQADVVRNTEFVKFFSFLPPMGEYAPTQCVLLQKLAR